jgi:ABC-type glycerol-3-phosphate transport system permease component
MASTSFKETQNIFSSPAEIIPQEPTLENFRYLFDILPFDRWVLNTLIVAASVTAIKVVIDSMAGYAFARRKFKGKEILFAIILGTMMIPVAVTMIPTFLMVKEFGLIDTYWGLILPPLAYPLGIYLMRQYMQSIPTELEDAAKIDGCTDFYLFVRIFLPLSAPAIAVLAIVTFMNQWISLLWPVIVTNSMEMRTLVVGISILKAQSVSNWGLIMAANFASFFPIMLVFIFLQRYFIEGMTVGAVKG